MATSLRSTLSQMATQFATGVMNAIRAASLEDILAETGGGAARSPGRPPRAVAFDGAARRGRKGRLERRSAQDITHLIDRIVTLLANKPRGLRAEQIREALSLEAKELPRPIAEALAGGKISKVGQKRATTYFTKGAAAARRGPARAKKAKGGGRKRRKSGGKKVAKKTSPASMAAVNGVSAA